MHNGRFCQSRRFQLVLVTLGRRDKQVNFPVQPTALVEIALDGGHQALRPRILEAHTLDAVPVIPVQARFADFPVVEHDMIRADAVEVVHGEDAWDAVLFRRIDNGSREHAVEEVDVDDIRLFLFNQRRDFFLCFKGIHHAAGGFQLLRGGQFAVKLHIADEIRALLTRQVLLVLHGEEDDFVPCLPQQIRQTEKVGFRTTAPVEVFIDQQNLHVCLP